MALILKKIASRLLTIPLAVLIVVFSLSNRGTVNIGFWPFSKGVDLPLFVIVLVAVLIGLLWGFLISTLQKRFIK